MHLGIWETQGNKNEKLTKGINDEEISEVISSISNFKACSSDGIPTELFKVLIPGKDDLEKSSKNNSNNSSGFKWSQSFNQIVFGMVIFQIYGIMHR
jgi:hypothetical protein